MLHNQDSLDNYNIYNNMLFQKWWIPWTKWRKLTEEHKEKIRQSNLWKKKSKECVEKMIKTRTWMKWSKERRERYVNNNFWENNPNWKWWIRKWVQKLRDSNKYKIWRLEVYKKDNYTCRKCWWMSKNLNAHHIESFAKNEKLRFNTDNWVTFCSKCHRKFHSIYWNDTNTEQFIQFINK